MIRALAIASLSLAGCTAIDDPFGWRLADADGGAILDAATPEVDGGAGGICAAGTTGDTCGGAPRVFCQGFEQAVGDSFEQVTTFAGAPLDPETKCDRTFAPGPVCHGQAVAHAQTRGRDQSAYFAFSFAPASWPNPVYVRTFVYVDPTTRVNGFSLFGVISVRTDDSYEYRQLQLQDSAGNLAFVGVPDIGAAGTPFAGGLTVGKWTCLELGIVGGTTRATQTLTLSVDGVEKGRFPELPGFSAAKAVIATLGVQRSPPDDGPDDRIGLYFDELAIASAPIGCK